MSDPIWALDGSVHVDSAGKPHIAGGQCPSCSLKLYPLATVCPQCWSKEIAPVHLATHGQLYTACSINILKL